VWYCVCVCDCGEEEEEKGYRESHRSFDVCLVYLAKFKECVL